MFVLGLDPGLQRTGFAVLEVSADRPNDAPALVDAGCVRLKASASVSARLLELERDLIEIIEAHRPSVAAVEKLYAHYKHPTTAITMGHARGVILLAIERAGVRLIELPSTEVKRSVTGHGHASKEQVADSVRTVLGLAHSPRPLDVSDAMAIALTATRRLAAAAPG